MSARVFLDTNVLVHVFDGEEPDKQEVARSMLEDRLRAGDAVLSTQVLQEFFVTVTRKLAVPLPENEAAAATRRFAVLPVVHTDTELVFRAIALSRAHRLSLWDSLIVEAASKAGCATLLSEDLQHGWKVAGLRIENPFLDLSP